MSPSRVFREFNFAQAQYIGSERFIQYSFIPLAPKNLAIHGRDVRRLFSLVRFAVQYIA